LPPLVIWKTASLSRCDDLDEGAQLLVRSEPRRHGAVVGRLVVVRLRRRESCCSGVERVGELPLHGRLIIGSRTFGEGPLAHDEGAQR
jgi:hypothetical protein